ncbi:MAG: hypothetical protein ACRCYE_14470 [Sarcina sp.]
MIYKKLDLNNLMAIYKNQQITMEAFMLLPKINIHLPSYYLTPYISETGEHVLYDNGLAITIFKIYKNNNILKCDVFNGFFDLSNRQNKFSFKNVLYKGDISFIEFKRLVELQLENLLIFEMGSRKAEKDFTNLLASNLILLKESISNHYSPNKKRINIK